MPPQGPVVSHDLGRVAFALPESVPGGVLTVDLRLEAGGETRAVNTVAIAVHPRRSAAGLPRIATADTVIAAFARRLGYDVVGQTERT